jgi:hypothetical protein
MSYILRNITRGDLSLTNTLHIKHNGYAKVDEVTEMMRSGERRGIIRISSDEGEELIEPIIEAVEMPIPSLEVEVPTVEVEVPVVEVEPVINTVEEIVEEEPELVEPVEEIEEKTEVANNSSKSFNYNRNDHKNKFKK